MQKGKPPEDLKVSQLISDLSDPESETFNKAVEAGLKTGISLNALQQTLRLLLSLDAPSPESPQRGASLKLPQLAPELYSARKLRDEIGRKETIVEFLRRVWKPWMDADVLSRVELRRLDPSADKAVENWLIHRKLPKDINLPTKKVRNDRALAADPSAVLKSRKLAQVVATRLREGRPVPGYNT
jgi:hypothetical protein